MILKRTDGYIALAKAQLDFGAKEDAIKTLQEGITETGDSKLNDYISWAEMSGDTSVNKKPRKILRNGNLSVEIYDDDY